MKTIARILPTRAMPTRSGQRLRYGGANVPMIEETTTLPVDAHQFLEQIRQALLDKFGATKSAEIWHYLCEHAVFSWLLTEEQKAQAKRHLIAANKVPAVKPNAAPKPQPKAKPEPMRFAAIGDSFDRRPNQLPPLQLARPAAKHNAMMPTVASPQRTREQICKRAERIALTDKVDYKRALQLAEAEVA